MALGPHSDPDYYSAHLFQGLIDLALEGTEQAAEGAPFELKARIPGHDVLEGITVGVGSTLTQSRLAALIRGRVTSPRTEILWRSVIRPRFKGRFTQYFAVIPAPVIVIRPSESTA